VGDGNAETGSLRSTSETSHETSGTTAKIAKARIYHPSILISALPVIIIEKNILSVHAAIHNVIANGMLKNSGCSGHNLILRR
jgi:hypothetical protein